MLNLDRTLFIAVLLITFAATPSQAESRICQTVNGRTVCAEGSGSLSCRTVNEDTVCEHGPAPRVPPQEALPELPPTFRGPDIPNLWVEIEEGRVRVRSGNLDIGLD